LRALIGEVVVTRTAAAASMAANANMIGLRAMCARTQSTL
jgi:hypothetical protein